MKAELRFGRAFFALSLFIGASAARAEIVRIDISEQREWIAGREFGAGQYELIAGTAHYEVDPKAASSADIADITRAPVNARGKVEFSGPFLVLRPMNAAKANGTTFFEVANRGGAPSNGSLYEAATMPLLKNQTDDISYAHVFDRGYTLAWAGWQADLKADAFGLTVPRAQVSGKVRATSFLNRNGNGGDNGPAVFGGVCAADAQEQSAELRIHKSYDDPGVIVPRKEWSFAKRGADGTAKPDPCAFLLANPIAGETMVSIAFTGQQPLVVGLGQAGVRDFISHLKHGEVKSTLNGRSGEARQVIGFGYSQSARFLRDFLYRGFNADASGRIIFDGILDVAAGAGRGSFNHRYASPGDAGNSVGSALRAVDIYPFADLPVPDIAGKAKAGLLDRAMKDKVAPKIFHIVTSSEYWARAASLIQVSADGKRALAEAPGTRTYYFAGVPHAPRPMAGFKVAGRLAPLPYNDNVDMQLALPALLEAMRKWVSGGEAPPPSARPVLGTELVEPAKLAFPKIPKVQVPKEPPPVWQLYLGPDYAGKHVVAEPPKLGPRYNLLVPQVNEDGNEIGGWRGVLSSVPLGTYTAWNVAGQGVGSFGLISGLDGAFIPFALDEAMRERWGDPRKSLAERYGGKEGYRMMVVAALEKQIANGFLLPQDRERAIEAAVIAWDRATIARGLWIAPPPQ